MTEHDTARRPEGPDQGYYTLQADGTYGYHEPQADGSYVYHQKLADGTYGYYLPQADGTQLYHRRLPDGSFEQWLLGLDGTFQAVAPVPAPAPVAAAPATPAVDPASSPATVPVPAVRSRRPAVIAGVAAGAVVLLAGGAVGAYLLLGGGDDAAGDDVAVLADIVDKPGEAWTADLLLGEESQYVSYAGSWAIGTDALAVSPVFDYYAFNVEHTLDYWYDGVEWTPDYDAQYDEGWAAGVAYAEADAEYWDEYWYTDVEAPDVDEYWPGDGSYESRDYASEGGFIHGFGDGVDGYSQGAHRLPEPVEPDFAPQASLISLETGETLWTAPLADYAGSGEVSVQLREGSDGASVIALVRTADDADVANRLVVLAREGGAVIGEARLPDGYISVQPEGDDLYVMVETSSDEEYFTTVSRYSLLDLDAGETWSEDIEGSVYSLGLEDGIVSVYANEVALLDQLTGDLHPLSRLTDEDTAVTRIGDVYVRIDREDDGDVALMAVDEERNQLWDEPLEAEMYGVMGGVLFVGDESDDYGFEDLMRVDLATGEGAWEQAVDGDDWRLESVHDGKVYVSSDDTLVQLSLKDGEELGDFPADAEWVYFAETMLFVVEGDEIVAVRTEDMKDVWSYRFDDDSYSVSSLGSFLVLWSNSTSELIGLGAASGADA
ncbi:outer membrane protein assembly factor BamB family protein [Demequina subtropica]|uniref:outer membrane protein assembly factor BamB family protein n=1 Tax=Demequina subtropica TaxID=1638989 RepID=UPI000783F07B|nr:PQQ-binding-like beta-propeller repeat protein [Demequina subtropica]